MRHTRLSGDFVSSIPELRYNPPVCTYFTPVTCRESGVLSVCTQHV